MLTGAGILVILGLLLVSAAAVGSAMLHRKVSREVAHMFRESGDGSPGVVTESDITALPEPVRRWLRYSQVISRERIRTVRLKMEGQFRLGPDKPWMPFRAEEYYTTDPPAFLWYTTMKMAPLLTISGRDRYYHGRGNMLIKLLSLFTVVDATGPELSQGTLLRYLNETMWFPDAALSEYIQWEPLDARSAKATMVYEGVRASAVFYFDDRGEITNMIADRYREADGRYTMDTWSTPIESYGEFHGIRIPVSGKGIWHLPDGDLTYIRLKITGIEYNVPEMY